MNWKPILLSKLPGLQIDMIERGGSYAEVKQGLVLKNGLCAREIEIQLRLIGDRLARIKALIALMDWVRVLCPTRKELEVFVVK